MTVVCYEMKDSMSGSIINDSEQGEQRKVRRRYVMGQLDGFNDVALEMEQYAPQYVTDGAGFYWVRRALNIEGIGNKYFDCTAEYETLLPKQGGGMPSGDGGEPSPLAGSIAWDTTGHTERIFQARTEKRRPLDAPNFRKAIGVNGSEVEGVEIVVPGMRYSETWIFPSALAFSDEYMGVVHNLTGTVNATQFRAFEFAEALFMGARCQWSGDQPFCSITFDFECRPSVDNYMVDGLEPFAKNGWEYVWVRYEDAVDNDTLVRKPKAAYLNQIYELGDFQSLLLNGRVGSPVTPLNPINPTKPVAGGF